MSRAQICAPDHRPGTDTEIVQARCDERRDPPFGFAAVMSWLLIGFQRKAGTSYSRSAAYGFGSMARYPNSMTEDVVVVKIAVHDPARRLTNFGEQFSCQRRAFPSLAARSSQRRTSGTTGRNGDRAGRRRPRCDVDRYRRRVRFWHRREIISGNGALLQDSPSPATSQAHRSIASPQLQRIRLVQRLIVATPRNLHDQVAGRRDIRNRRQCKRRS